MPPARRRQLQKEETRKIIKETAYSLFEKDGYEMTTMRSLAKAAGVGVGTIFSHFPDKLSLLAAALLEDVNQSVEQAFASLPERNIHEQLEHIVRVLYSYYAQKPNLSRTIISRLFFLEGPNGQDLEKQLSDFLSRIGHLLMQARDNQEIAPDIDITLCVQAFGSFYIAGLHSGLKGDFFDVDHHAKLFSSLMGQFLSNQKA